MKRKRNATSSESFVDRLRNSSTLKVKYGGAYHSIPPTILNQAKKFALHSVDVDYDVFSKGNPVPSSAKDAEIQKAFEDFLQGYIESIMPLGNPSSPKSEKVFELLKEHFNTKERTLQKWYRNPRDEVDAKRLLKSAVMKVAQVYLDGALGVRTKEEADLAERELELKEQFDRGQLNEEEFKNQKMWFRAQGRAKTVFKPGDDEKAQRMVVFYRTLRNVYALVTAAVVSKILATDATAFSKAVGQLTDRLEKDDLEGKQLQETLLNPLSEEVMRQLRNVDVVEAIRATKINPSVFKKPKKEKKAAKEAASQKQSAG